MQVDEMTSGARVRYTSITARLQAAFGTMPHASGSVGARGAIAGEPEWVNGEQWVRVRWDDGAVTFSPVGEIEAACDE